jgi:malate dehydrogenase (oxaloacetate-decarboxylating)
MSSPSAQYSLTIRIEIADRPGMLGAVASAIGQAGASIGSIDLVEVKEGVLRPAARTGSRSSRR